jgi:hypothetical protein
MKPLHHDKAVPKPEVAVFDLILKLEKLLKDTWEIWIFPSSKMADGKKT